MGIAISPAQVDPRVANFIEKPRPMMIDGQWTMAASGKTAVLVYPPDSRARSS